MSKKANWHELFHGLHGDLEDFADRVSTYLGCPITIEDANHRLLAYSMHDDRTDKARISTIIGRRVPENVINTLWKEGIIPTLLKGRAPVKVPSINDVGLGSRAAVSIWKNSEVLGFIWALEVDKPFTEDDLEFLQFSAKEAKNQILQLQTRKHRRLESAQEFLWQLLTGHFQDKQEIREKFIKHAPHVPTNFSILVFQFPEVISVERERQISYMLSTTQKIKADIFTTDRNKLIILVGFQDNQPIIESLSSFIDNFILQMNVRFNVHNISGASGMIYTNLAEAMESYREALQVLSLQQMFPDDTAKVYLYSQLGAYKYLETLHKHQDKSGQNIHLTRLQSYDAKHQTDLYETLKIYLEKDSNPNEAAKALHIHVNTLTYRLKRITDVGEINLKDPLQKVGLFLDIKLRIYENFYNNP
ncbi:DNA-binding PucR family transcriptional regulator [Peribacillus deserti]|uniref:DNA-binding PucR family transcriptional regulator n=1 Tax=Peribacillus deserti TaxID=673318 RepID=A0ABS2QM33_9BACI|nr:helix-turn-helix domain-containing protein [Peribacillus deserti]MBM7694237.1 DNA-binding PucR family transcriptional regulator [Peribacillus deserti]